MSKTNKINQDDVFMQIEKFGDKGPYFVQVPKHFSKILDKLMSDDDETDHRSCKAVLKIFCEEFAALDEDEQDKVETLINCNIRPLNSIYDLLELLIQRDKYYVLIGVNTNRKLGEFHIFVARRNYPDSWIAQRDFSEAKIVAKRVKQIEKGVFYRDDYVGRYCSLEKEE